MNLIRFLFEHQFQSFKTGIRAGVAYVHFIGARECVSGFGDTTEEALYDAFSRMRGGLA